MPDFYTYDSYKFGTHQGKSGPFPNTKHPEHRANRSVRRARRKLETRRKAFDELKSQQGRRRPGSLKHS